MSEIKRTKASDTLERIFRVDTEYSTRQYYICYDENTKLIHDVSLVVSTRKGGRQVRITNLDIRAILHLMKEYGFVLTVEGGENKK